MDSYTAHRDTVADGAVLAIEDDEISGQRGNHALQGERYPGGQDAQAGGETTGIVELDREQPEDQ